MKKVVSPTSGGNMPPLVVMGKSEATPAAPYVQTFLLKKVSPSKSSMAHLNSTSSSSPVSNMRLVKTTDGKNLLLTNVVGTSKVTADKHVIMMPQTDLSVVSSTDTTTVPSAVQQSSVSPVKLANAPRTVVLNPAKRLSLGDNGINQPIILQIPGLNQPIVVKQFPSDPVSDENEESSSVVPEVTPEENGPTTTPTTSTCTTLSISPTSSNSVTISPCKTATTSTTFKSIPSSRSITSATVTSSTTTSTSPITSTSPTISTFPIISTSPITNTFPIISTSPITSTASIPIINPTASIINNPVISTAPNSGTQANSTNPVMYLKSGNATYKVVGKPVPVKLFPKPPKIAPKILMNKDAVQKIPLPPLRKNKKFQPLSSFTSVRGTPSAEPPAYLNIRIKEEPRAVEEIHEEENIGIKEENEEEENAAQDEPQGLNNGELEGIDTMLDISIKEEPRDDQTGELLARDEQLRQVLGVANNLQAAQQPRFFIRTSEGKLVTISPEEAEALGLNYHDKVENNQKKLMNALSFFKNSALHKAFGQDASNLGQDGNILIPHNVSVKDFVSCHVSPAAEKNATIMKTLGSKRLETKNKILMPPQSNTTIIGEYTDSDHRFLRVEVETEPNKKDICDVTITPLNNYQCPFCIKEFKTKDHIVSHLRIHTGERPYPCEVCGKRYRQRIDIIRHMRIHTGEKPFTCGLCDASFNQKSNLRSHMRIHTGERPVQCNVCGKGFSRNTHLKQHMKLHTGEKPFQCKVCYRPFRFKSGLQAHERIHTGLKPYACSLCGRTFTQIVGLLRHERTHVGEKPFRCQSCGKSFNHRENLKVHVLKHTSARPYGCDMCEKSFTDKSALRCHRKKYHCDNLICVICLREDFKDRIELREHLRAHERENWRETPTGELVPVVRDFNSEHFISVDDTLENIKEKEGVDGDDDKSLSLENVRPEEIQVEVDLEPDNPMDDDDTQEDEDSEYEEHELHIGSSDPLA